VRATTGQATRRTAALPLALVAIVLLVASAARWEHRPTSDLPQRITIHSRDYAKGAGAAVDLAVAREGSGSWQRVGTAGTHDRPVLASVGDYTPIVVYVQLGADSYEGYDLIGGP
jgi:hypothetical protein